MRRFAVRRRGARLSLHRAQVRLCETVSQEQIMGGERRHLNEKVFFSSNPVVSAKTAILGAAARSGVPEYADLLSPLHRECLRHDVAFGAGASSTAS